MVKPSIYRARRDATPPWVHNANVRTQKELRRLGVSVRDATAAIRRFGDVVSQMSLNMQDLNTGWRKYD